VTRKFIYLTCCLLASCAVGWQTDRGSGVLTGQVLLAHGRVLEPRAFVYVHGYGGTRSNQVVLDRNANFEISLPPGLYDVFVGETSSIPVCQRVEVSAGETTHFEAELNNDEEHMEK
jgi:hypothetical protein